jgi:hypothetical protein
VFYLTSTVHKVTKLPVTHTNKLLENVINWTLGEFKKKNY